MTAHILASQKESIGERERNGAARSEPRDAEEVPGERLIGDRTPQKDEAAFYDNAGHPEVENERGEPERQDRQPIHPHPHQPEDEIEGPRDEQTGGSAQGENLQPVVLVLTEAERLAKRVGEMSAGDPEAPARKHDQSTEGLPADGRVERTP